MAIYIRRRESVVALGGAAMWPFVARAQQGVCTLAIAPLCFGLITVPANAQGYPEKPIKIVVAAAPGGPTDVPARLAAQILSPKLGQPVVVENRAGAGGAIGAREVATAAPDGYTLLMGNTSTLAVIPAVSTTAGYDPIKNFMPIVRITEGFQILVVHPSSPWRSVKQVIDDTNMKPGMINYAHTGAGGLPHLAGELFMLRSGAKMTGVSYRSGGESVTAVLSQAVHLTFENVAILVPQIREGKLRALAAQNASRSKLLPDLPTMAEVGVPNAEANTFFGLVAPVGTPASIISKLNQALNEGMQSSEIQQLIANVGSESKPNSPQEFATYIATQHRKWVEVGKAAGVKLN
jgi:tripartite-type tricarboxylate transporter receptor subunit TctC